MALMLAVLIILAIALLAALLLLYMIAPGRQRDRAVAWRGTPFAHRGLHGADAPENSLSAFECACAAGCGIELDVQLSADGEVIVFHDDELLRMTGDSRSVSDLTLAQLRVLRLPDGSGIPTFREVLDCVRGRVPLLVELKNGARNAQLCESTLRLLEAYDGKYIIESFHPMILRWFRRNAPGVIRGQLVGSREDYLEKYGPLVALVLPNMLHNFIGRPDFVAYNLNTANLRPVRWQRSLFKTPLAAWTVNSEAQYKSCVGRGDMPIFEGFNPLKK